MGFAGNLNTLSLVEVFQTISRIRATGILRLAATDHGRDVVFADGEIIGLRFRAGEERLGLLRRLILEGRLDANSAANISNSKQDSATILAGLIEKGQLSQEDVLDAFQRQAEDELYNLCTWQFADFVFHDAIPEEPQIIQEVDACRPQPLKININSLLMESARRMDEWDRLRKVITSEDVVLGHADGREQQLLAESSDYPGSAVVPLIDAVRTVESIIRESVATRLDVYSVLAGLFKNGLVAVLSRDDIIAHGDFQFENKNFHKAAELFRRALSEDPADRATKEKLADCLEQLGEQPEAAGCFAQLALGYLDEGNGTGAVSSANRAVRLASDDPRQRMILVRCLLDTGDQPGAIRELLWIASRYLELGQLEDSRGTCLKVLELDPQNEDARRDMARIFASAERDADSEDVVVCVQCAAVNHREATSCKECESPLRLSCQSCNRTVAVSDKICIFCGANPHAAGARKLLSSPATTRIVNKLAKTGKAGEGSRGSSFWQSHLEGNIKKARELEEAGDIAGSLESWREVAKINLDNKELLDHIRELEARVSDDFAEKAIERGHQLRRARRFFAALKSYRSAIRTIPEDDPRHPRLKEILKVTAKDHQRIMVIYAAAFLAIGIFGWLVARPYLLLSTFRNELSVTRALLISNPPGTSQATFDTLVNLSASLNKLEEQSQRLGNHSTATEAKTALNGFRSEVNIARIALADAAQKDINTALKNKDVSRAEQLLLQLRQPEFQETMGPRLAAIEALVADVKRQQSDFATRQKQAPEELELAKEMEKKGDLARSLAGYRALAELNHQTISPVAKEGVIRLEPAELAFNKIMAQALTNLTTDVGQADKISSPLAADAKKWNKTIEFDQLRKDIAAKLQAAATAYQQLGSNPTTEALQSFIQSNPNTPQAAQARARYDQLMQAIRLRDEQIVAYHAAMTGQQTEQAWRIARNLFAGGAALPEDVRLPIRIESMPAGAQVIIDGKQQGVTPCVIGVLPNQVQMNLQLTLDGWQKYERKVGELVTDWRAQLSLTRTARWQVALGKPVNALMGVSDGALALAGDALHRIGKDGTVMWRASVAAVDELSDLERFRLAHQPQITADGSLLVGLPTKDVAYINAQGAIQRRLPSASAVHGRPQTYTNDLLGGQERVAYAADRLYIGVLNQDPVGIDLPSPALSGPISVPRGPDRLLAVATIQGQLVAYEESSKKRLWQSDLKATEIGQLIPVGIDSFVTVLDGSRIACFQITDTGLQTRWNVTLPGPAIGDPVVVGKAVWVAAGTNVVRVSTEGIASQIAGKIPLVTAVSALGDIVAVGNKAGQVVVFQNGKLLWASQCQALPTSVACTSDGVVVGMADGTLSSYTP